MLKITKPVLIHVAPLHKTFSGKAAASDGKFRLPLIPAFVQRIGFRIQEHMNTRLVVWPQHRIADRGGDRNRNDSDQQHPQPQSRGESDNEYSEDQGQRRTQIRFPEDEKSGNSRQQKHQADRAPACNPEERSSALPEDTKSHPLEMWVKGYLQQDEAQVGDEVEVITRTGRHATGKLVNEAPYFEHNFGFLIPEVLKIGDMVREITFGGNE